MFCSALSRALAHRTKAEVTLLEVPRGQPGPQKLLTAVVEVVVAGESSGSGDSGAKRWPALSGTSGSTAHSPSAPL
jgi:hypothetical protein